MCPLIWTIPIEGATESFTWTIPLYAWLGNGYIWKIFLLRYWDLTIYNINLTTNVECLGILNKITDYVYNINVAPNEIIYFYESPPPPPPPRSWNLNIHRNITPWPSDETRICIEIRKPSLHFSRVSKTLLGAVVLGLCYFLQVLQVRSCAFWITGFMTITKYCNVENNFNVARWKKKKKKMPFKLYCYPVC